MLAKPSLAIPFPQFESLEEAQNWAELVYKRLARLDTYLRETHHVIRDAQSDTENVGDTTLYTITNNLTDRTFDADATSVAELADVLATLINDLKMTS